MNDTVSNDDRDRYRVTEHKVTFEIDPQLETDVLAMPYGIVLQSVDRRWPTPDYPTRVGLAVLAYLRTARRIALDEADQQGR